MTYKVVLTQTEEGYSVGCPELSGCWSEGESKEEAIANIREAIGEYLSVQPKAEFPTEVHFVEVPEALEAGGDAPKAKIRHTKFVVTPISSGPFPPEWTSHKVEDLMRILAERAKPPAESAELLIESAKR